MTPINRARVQKTIRRRSQHDKAMMLGKYLLFIHLNIVPLAEIIMMNNRCQSVRLRGHVTPNDMKKTALCSSFTVGKYHLTRTKQAQLISFSATDSFKSAGANAISFSQPVYVFIYLHYQGSCGECLVVMFAESPFPDKAKPLLTSLEPQS